METNLKAIELRDLWRRYKDERDEKARERLVLAYAPLVKYVAGRMSSGLPSHVEEADLISYGLLGLISAIERFEPEREIKFETFAITRIKGSIIDELRSLDWVPRSVRTKAREIERANAKLEHELHRAPTDQEMAEQLGVDGRGVPGVARPHLQLVRGRARRAVDRLGRLGRPGLAARHDPGPAGARPRHGDGHDRDEGPAGRRDRAAAGAREARGGPLLLREPDPARDRRGARRDRVARLAAPHEGRAAPQVAPAGRPLGDAE